MVEKYYFTKKFKKMMKKTLIEKYSSFYNIDDEVDLKPPGIKAPVDLVMTSPSNRYLIEYEIHRADPSNNIAKIAYYLDNVKSKSNITVIQIFSPYYLRTNGELKAKAVLAKFLGHQLIEKRFEKLYCPLFPKVYTQRKFQKLYESFTGDSIEEKPFEMLRVFVQDVVDQIETIIY